MQIMRERQSKKIKELKKEVNAVRLKGLPPYFLAATGTLYILQIPSIQTQSLKHHSPT